MTANDDRTLFTTGVIDAPPGAVFAAFAEPARLARWWGPAGFSNTFEAFDFRPGGTWRFTMHGPDGKQYPNESRFVEIERDRRVVLDHVVAPLFRAAFDLRPADGGRTHLDWRMTFENAATLKALLPIIEPANRQNIERLQAELRRAA